MMNHYREATGEKDGADKSKNAEGLLESTWIRFHRQGRPVATSREECIAPHTTRTSKIAFY